MARQSGLSRQRHKELTSRLQPRLISSYSTILYTICELVIIHDSFRHIKPPYTRIFTLLQTCGSFCWNPQNQYKSTFSRSDIGYLPKKIPPFAPIIKKKYETWNRTHQLSLKITMVFFPKLKYVKNAST